MATEPPGDKAPPQPRTPRLVINEAIRESAGWDQLCWWGVIAFGLAGVVTIIAGVWQGSAGMSVAGLGSEGLCWPALRYAVLMRRGNVALRLLEVALNNADTADEALRAINRAFSTHFS